MIVQCSSTVTASVVIGVLFALHDFYICVFNQ